MKTNSHTSPRDLLRGILESQKHLLEQKAPQNLQKEQSHHVLLRVFHNPHQSQRNLASRQTQGKHIAHKLKPSQEKKEVDTQETTYILTEY